MNPRVEMIESLALHAQWLITNVPPEEWAYAKNITEDTRHPLEALDMLLFALNALKEIDFKYPREIVELRKC